MTPSLILLLACTGPSGTTNQAPVIASAAWVSEAVTTNDDAQVVFEGHDPDGDELYWDVAWSRDGEELSFHGEVRNPARVTGGAPRRGGARGGVQGGAAPRGHRDRHRPRR